jgi:hypothetical protein
MKIEEEEAGGGWGLGRRDGDMADGSVRPCVRAWS